MFWFWNNHSYVLFFFSVTINRERVHNITFPLTARDRSWSKLSVVWEVFFILFSVFRLFPPDLFEKFIDVGHYVRELNSYKVLVDKISALTVNFKHYIY